ncbi:hypothetical protein MMC30_008071 [Trapelia coarctata]|nr:hypothetical protein [Trapelia coarctata]
MDPLSVSAGIVGILTAAAAITNFIGGLLNSANGAPQSIRHVLTEVTGISTCLSELQAFLLGTREVPRSRSTMLMVEQIIVTLTGCVTAFSDLEKTLEPLKTSQPLRILDRIRWGLREEKSIGRILARLQVTKTSLNLMLTTLTWYIRIFIGFKVIARTITETPHLHSISVDEAHTSSQQLEGLVHEVLTNNRDISTRLRRLEMQLSAAAASNSFQASSFIKTLDDNMTTRSLIADRAKNQTINQTLTYGFTFDEELQASMVYARAAQRHSHLSLPSATRSIGWSFFSGISLAKISNISVLSLPIMVEEICNGHTYYNTDERTKAPVRPVNHQGFKLLLLGDTQSGKTTILNQFRLLNGHGLSKVERNEGTRMVQDFLVSLSSLIEKPSQLVDDPDFYLNNLGRIASDDYLATDQDILALPWARSTGIYGQAVNVANETYHVYDVGGWSSERRKWEYAYYKDPDCVMIVVPLSSYNEASCEDPNMASAGDVKAMDGHLELFKSLPNFTGSSDKILYLVFNKMDIFEEKILYDPMSKYFPDYTGGADVTEACGYWEQCFRKLVPEGRQMEVTFTTAISPSFKTVIDAVHEKMLEREHWSQSMPGAS